MTACVSCVTCACVLLFFACVIFLRLLRFLRTFYFACVSYFFLLKTLRALRAFEWKLGCRRGLPPIPVECLIMPPVFNAVHSYMTTLSSFTTVFLSSTLLVSFMQTAKQDGRKFYEWSRTTREAHNDTVHYVSLKLIRHKSTKNAWENL